MEIEIRIEHDPNLQARLRRIVELEKQKLGSPIRAGR